MINSNLAKLTDDLVPNRGVGRIILGGELTDRDLIGAIKVKSKVNKRCFSLLNDSIEITFSNDFPAIVKWISVRNKFTGSLLGKYCIGGTIKSLVQDENWKFSEMASGVVSEQYPGVIIFPNLDDLSTQEFESKLDEIYIAEISLASLTENLLR